MCTHVLAVASQEVAPISSHPTESMATMSSTSEKVDTSLAGLGEVLSADESAPSSENALDDVYHTYKTAALDDVTPEEERRVLRKIDIRVVPILFGIYLAQYLVNLYSLPSRPFQEQSRRR